MTNHKIGTRQEWLAARLELLKAEKELTRRSDELAQWRQELPWVRIDKEYRFETDEGTASLADLFRGRSQLLVYHFMFGPEYSGGCPACSAVADGFNGFAVHFEHHDVAMIAVSRAPIAALQAYKRRMGWTFPWVSSLGSDFNYDFNTSFTEEQQREGGIEYNYRREAAEPRVPGHEVAGVVDSMGEDVKEWKRGQRVAVGWHGGHCGLCESCRRGVQGIMPISFYGVESMEPGMTGWMPAACESIQRYASSRRDFKKPLGYYYSLMDV
jgi:predicted dithiol-disulfide oxidoreductase (DUF899 family)